MITQLENPIDQAEWQAVTHDIIGAFQHRGYALYPIGAADSVVFIGSKEMLGELVTFGPAEDVIELGIRYVPLPLVHKNQRSDPMAVFAAVDAMVQNMRGPYFIDLKTLDDGSVEPQGSHLVDSIYIESPYLYLVIDSRFGSQRTGTIEINLVNAAHQIRAQLMLALRASSVTQQAKDAPLTVLGAGVVQ